MEIVVVAVVALIVFGPERLPQMARTVGRTVNELRRQAAEIRAEFESGLDDPEPDDRTARDARPVRRDGGAAVTGDPEPDDVRSDHGS